MLAVHLTTCTFQSEGSSLEQSSSQKFGLQYRFGPYFVSPVIAGLDEKTNEPYICGMDTIGAIETAKDFMVAGTAPDSLYGMCESMWQPDMVSLQEQQLQPMYVCPSHSGCCVMIFGCVAVFAAVASVMVCLLAFLACMLLSSYSNTAG